MRAGLAILLSVVLAGCSTGPHGARPGDAGGKGGGPVADAGVADGGAVAAGSDAGLGPPPQVVQYDGGGLDLDGGVRDLPVTPIRGFRCRAGPRGRLTQVASLGQDGGPAVDIASEGGCVFDLLLHPADGGSVTLSSAPHGYLLAGMTRLVGGGTAVCASSVNHVPGAAPGLDEIRTVDIRCWVRRPDGSVLGAEAVPPDPAYAAWVASVSVDPAHAGTFQVEWVRDFSFQFLNLSDQGRPATDGTYETHLHVGGGALLVDGTRKVASSTLRPGPTGATRWVPTAREAARLGPYMALPDPLDGGPVTDGGGTAADGGDGGP